MDRILLRHLDGSSAGRIAEIPLDGIREIRMGADPSAAISLGADAGGPVEPSHARIAHNAMGQGEFLIIDLSSGGTYINDKKVEGAQKLSPGDVIQLGQGGPKFQFDVAQVVAATERAAAAQSATTQAPAITKSPGRKRAAVIYAVLIVLVLGAMGYFIYQNYALKKQFQQEMDAKQQAVVEEVSKAKAEIASLKESAPMPTTEMLEKYSGAVTYVEVGWKLIYSRTGQQVFHEYVPNRWKDKDGKERPILGDGRRSVASYVLIGKDTLEPALTTTSGPRAIGGEHTGSGFVVNDKGFILTNRHVAAAWRSEYVFPQDAYPGIVWEYTGGRWQMAIGPDGKPLLVKPPRNWTPSETKQFGRQGLQGGFEGRNDYLNITFPKTEQRTAAQLVSVSDKHDVALMKIEVPEALPSVEFNDNYDTIKVGDPAIVVGYTGASPDLIGVVKAKDVNSPASKARIIPSPNVSVGTVSKVLRGREKPDEDFERVISMVGDVYQLSISSVGHGNSGGPVFDDRGRVIGILFAGISDPPLSFVVPIRYGRELMGIGPK